MAKVKAQITIFHIIDIKATHRYYLLQSSTLAKPSKPTTFPPPSGKNLISDDVIVKTETALYVFRYNGGFAAKKGITYTFSTNYSTSNLYVRAYNDFNNIKTYVYSKNSISYTPAEDEYLSFNVYVSSGLPEDIVVQLEVGTEATSYEPYSDSKWNDTEPSYTEGSTNSLYFVDCTVFSDDTFIYSDVSLSSSYEASKLAYNKAQNAQDTANNAQENIDNLEIGGRNLLLETRNFSDPWFSRNLNETCMPLYDSENDIWYAKVYHGDSGSWVQYIKQHLDIEPNQYYTVSLLARKNSDINPYLNVRFDRDAAITNFYNGYGFIVTSTEWTKFSFTAKTHPDSGDNEPFTIFASFNATGGNDTGGAISYDTAIDVAFVKLEKGNRATDWTPAPEDTDQRIDDVSNETYKVIEEQSANITNTCEGIVLESLKEYTKTTDFDEFKSVTESELSLIPEKITASVSETKKQIENIDGQLKEVISKLTKYFTFDIDGLTIGQIDSPFKVIIDNDRYSMMVNGVEVLWLNPDGKSNIPELMITKSLNLFGYVIDQDENGNVNCGYAGE